ncbi:MHYT domain-containing protein [Caldalkalibacillus salinus]|uniref:MHYT domain-containing protein n=1 Tax=Caldalkalibacillus salinus TaxID=2803787 RepID=UPI001920D40C|nr:MHYT domain-containing protein [Caldalkalibacillus salinus]
MDQVTGSYDYSLVLLSYLIATLAAYTALSLIGRLYVYRNYFWLIAAGVCLGTGVWAMHFISMLAFHLDAQVQVSYDLTYVVISILFAILSSLLSLYICAYSVINAKRLAIGAFILGLGLTLMHFIGMRAMQIDANMVMHFSAPYVFLSFLASSIDALVAFYLAFWLRKSHSRFDTYKVVSAFLMGIAICGVHYIGMLGTTFWLEEGHVSSESTYSINTQILGLSIALTTCFILGTFILTIFFDRRIKESQERYRSLYQNSPEMILILNPVGEVIHSNPAGYRTLGLSKHEIKKKRLADMLLPDDLASFEYSFYQSLKGMSSEVSIRAKHTRGDMIYLKVTTYPFMIEENLKGIFLIGKDKTASVKSEEALRKLNDEHTLILNAMYEGVFGLDLDLNVTFWNPATERMTGYKKEEVLGRRIPELIRRDSQLDNPFQGQGSPIRQSMETGKVIHCKDDLFWKKDGYSFPVDYTCTPIMKLGMIVGTVVTFRDITERKEAEAYLNKSEKLSVAGELAAGIAHEIRNPLTAIKGFMTLIRPTTDAKYFDIIHSEISRMEFIVSELLMLSKPQTVNYNQKDVQRVIQQVVTLLESQANLNNILMTYEHEQEPLYIMCDENQIKQVFINFIKNAIEAMPQGGEIKIKAYKDEDQAVVQVIDQGSGIPEEKLERIGQPFYTTKEKGTGLGLMVSFNIIENHDGQVEVKSKVNEGTTFTTIFPLYRE